MKLSLNWLKQYVDLPKDLTANQLSYDLTMSTVEVEEVVDQAQSFEKMVVGKIVELKKHPNADKLQIAMTDIGNKEPVQIICGGTNLVQDMFVLVALPGSKVRWHGEGNLVQLEETKIRGKKSFGMICASSEVGLDGMFPSSSVFEIIDLSNLKNIKPGQNITQALNLNDVIIEIDNKSLTNRPDLWNHFGVARELSAIYKTNLKQPTLSKNKAGKDKELEIEIKSKELCPRYMGCIVENIKIGKSPDWLIKKLEAVGSRAINNIVDITNYVMQDVGEPMHAFDRSKVSKIIIRSAKKSEAITTLDGEERKLDEDMLVIADNKKSIAIAGVMGGANSEIDEKTTSIILEAANFSGSSVRKTSQQLNLRTEASIRFEKNLDLNFTELGILRALELIKEICPDAIIHPIVDINHISSEVIEIEVEHAFLKKKIGQEIEIKEVKDILNRLGFKVLEKKGIYKIIVPSWRATGDVSIPEDIVEEVARIYGYDNLIGKKEFIEFTKAKYQAEYDLENKIKNYLAVGCGMHEVFNYPWAEKKILDKYGLTQESAIEIQNPPAKKNKYLQTSLLPNLLKNVKDNLRFYAEYGIFEMAQIYLSGQGKIDGEDKLPIQYKMLGAVLVSNKNTFLKIKGIVEGLEKITGCEIKLDIDKKFNKSFVNKSKILLCDKEVGRIIELKDRIKNKEVVSFEINFDLLVDIVKSQKEVKQYVPIPQYPSMARDLAFELSWDTKWGSIKQELKEVDELITDIEFLSEYDLGEKKSVAFRVTYQADRTLKDEEVENIQNKIIKLIEKKFEGKLRK